MSLPSNQRKLEVVALLAGLAEDSGVSLIELAVGFVLSNPGVTSVIIGPRTMEQLTTFLSTADAVLEDDILDRIDEVSTPGIAINPMETDYGVNELAPSARRRKGV